jgi:hypothetical protein
MMLPEVLIILVMHITVIIFNVMEIQVKIGRDQDTTVSCLQLALDFQNLHLGYNTVELTHQAGYKVSIIKIFMKRRT